ncbi:formylglycine-generating enzyme family protein [bacterium]|nr:formylglycine-generating enzyme family protein [bacterium]
MHESFEQEGSKIVMLIVAQKEPHAGTLAYKDISQPETVAERTKLAKRMKEEFELPMTVLVDSMKDSSRELFTDLPSPAFIIDAQGVLCGKMSWAQPEDISDFLSTMEPGMVAVPEKQDSQVSQAPAVPVINKPDVIEYQPPVQWVTVSVENQTGNSLILQRVDFDEVQTVLNLGNAEKQELRVASGYYVLSLAENESSGPGERNGAAATSMRWPVPADARLSQTLEMTVSLHDVPENLREQWGYIPAGPAVVGDVIGLGRDEERPARIENIKAFLIGRYEVSNQQYTDFLNDQEQVPNDWLDLKSRKCLIRRKAPSNDKVAALENETAKSRPGFVTTSPNKPVVMVSREGARQYCQWLTQKTNVVHRLATEAEWEKAARGPESFLYAYGNICRISAANQESGHLRDSGQFAPNGFGLYDMTGNCFEWVSGEFATSTKLTGLLRGGSFIFDGIYNRTSFRMRQAPTVMTDDIGFRVVREMK